ncbi:ABC transporter ATP-binding protein [Natribaculum luteum]|uniref:ABC transporter ATP-binding protein n=1 Tax=Natribaculum luteum TaxID=1586232 RepID=A0ABD5NXG7_9EURY|nr:ABC transporter ATP-binding protein [Natribaculum luteum]
MVEVPGGIDRQPSSSRVANDRRSTSNESREPVLAVENLTKTYGSNASAVRALDGIDFEVERGAAVGLLGPNGAGKTTAIKTLLGLVVPDEGTAVIDGVDVGSNPRVAYRSVSAMLEGARNVYWRLTVRENLRFFARLGGRPADEARIDELIGEVGLADRADVTVNELSRGMKQRTSLACTLVRETPVAFLDEPTLGLDVESSRELRTTLRRMVEAESRTILLSSHDMDVVEEVCDRVVVLNEGSIVADDTVENLVDVFRTQTYRVTVDGTLSGAYRRTLEERFGAENWAQTGTRQRFDATRAEGERFYEMMDVVRASSCPLVSVDALEPNLEDVFVRLTSEDER